MKFYALLAASAVAMSCAPVQAAVIFSDGFEADAEALTVTNLTNFVITGGVSVDIVGTATDQNYGMSVTSKVVDLDGTPGPAEITSKNSFSFNAGDKVRLSFDVGGSQRSSATDDFFAGFAFTGAVDLIDYGFNFGSGDVIVIPAISTGGVSTSTGIAGNVPLATRSLFFTAGSAGALKIQFGTGSHDNVGPLLDNVVLDIMPVPEPASWALMIGGFALAGAAMRRRTAVARFA